MASRKNLKKDINYLVNEVVSDCLAYLFVHHDKNKEKAMKIVDEVINTRNELVLKVNMAKREKDPKKVKQHFLQLRKDMFTDIDKSFQSLSSLSK